VGEAVRDVFAASGRLVAVAGADFFFVIAVCCEKDMQANIEHSAVSRMMRGAQGMAFTVLSIYEIS
jgi:hypothetical protein